MVALVLGLVWVLDCGISLSCRTVRSERRCGISLVAEYDLPKVGARVRFSYPAPSLRTDELGPIPIHFPSTGREFDSPYPHLWKTRNGILSGPAVILDIYMDKQVSIYTTPTCHFCQMTKEFFKANNVAYSEFDVAADPAKRTEMIDKSGQMGVPVIFIGDDMVIGFDKKRLSELLGIADAPAGDPGM